MSRILPLSVLGLLALALPAVAHHSAVQFDFTRNVRYTGVVKEFAAINPHMRLLIDVKDDEGLHTVKFEGHSTNNMYRNGYRKGMIKVGDTVTVSAAPLRSGDLGGYVIGVSMADGTFFGAQPRPGAAGAADAAAETKRVAEGK
ncbi:MAG: hypothetical protein RL030_1910 [Pseudomonadota bacterium]